MIFTIWLIPTAVSASFVIDHNDEVNKLKRQFAAEGMLRAFLTGPMEKGESYKKDIASVIGFQGPYDIEKFKLSEVIKNEEERRKNVLIAIFLLIGTGVLVLSILLAKKNKFKQLFNQI